MEPKRNSWPFAPLAQADGASGRLTIDLGALARNYAALAARAAPALTAAVVKANAYGLGAEHVARTLLAAGCRHFFVAQAEEALALRPVLPPAAQVIVLNGLQPGCELAYAGAGIVPVLNSLEQLQRWQTAAQMLGRRLPALLQFDTGMSRLGVSPQDRPAFLRLLHSAALVEPLFVMSHLASADEPDSPQNLAQLAEMQAVQRDLPGVPLCFANSGGVLMGGDFRGSLVRPGLALYGGAPQMSEANPMEPVVTLEVAVIQTRTVPAGTRVGYGGTHVTHGVTHLATLAAGYADGLPRCLGGRGAVYCDGVRLPMVGRVSMDSLTVDISALPEGRLGLGDAVEVIGPHQSLEDLARDADTIAYEILTRLGTRYQRRYLPSLSLSARLS